MPVPNNVAAPAASGLTSEEAARRRAAIGPNALPEARQHPWRQVAAKFWAPIPWMLEVAVVLELVLGKYLEAAIIAALLAFNVLLSTVNERRAQTALVLLRQRLAILTRVRRDGRWQQVPAEELVPGDVIHLRVGDLVPADTRLFDGELLLDQAALTGEALPVELVSGGLAYAGAVVKRGEATGTVEATGPHTAFGKTAELVRTAQTPSHLEHAILQLVRRLLVLDLALVAAVLVYALLTNMSASEILPFVLILLVASVPVALPATFTLATTVGADELAHHGVLVTHLAAIEEAAGMDVLCTDKTGTLTEGKLALAEVRPEPPFTQAEVSRLAALACDESTQDPLDLAILAAVPADSPDAAPDQRIQFVPFDPATKRAEALVRHAGATWRVVKGAPDVVATLVRVAPPTFTEDVTAMAETGLRVLAVAAGPEGDLQLAGILGFQDPPRHDSKELVQDLHALGIRVVMVTGDGAATAHTIAGQVGLDGHVCETALLKDGEPDQVLQCDVFAGVYPEEKFDLVATLQRGGHVVGMTGDGVNDAPALRQAEVGIAVANATDVAKAAASLVLTTPGLGNIVTGIDASRRIYQRMLTYTLNMSVKKLALPVLLSGGLLLSSEFVVSPRLMILLLFANDFVTMALTTDRVVAAQNPQRWQMSALLRAALILALPLLALSLGIFFVGRSALGLTLAQAQTLVFVWLVFSGQATVYVARARGRFWRPRPSNWLLASTLADVVVVSLLATQGWLMAPIALWHVAALAVLAIGFLLAMSVVINRVAADR
ncbi:MAG: plasma-membrane proton-efflux P-type ATPase [Chloroflexi bacterium]|nr:MAG: plasma-membrane proton-efflux P-type ATPase [Chloroflexota bacterium]